jgi:hypothetical protein
MRNNIKSYKGVYTMRKNGEFILIPENIDRAMKRNSLSLSNIFDYSKMRSIFSVTDLAKLMLLNSGSEEVRNSVKITNSLYIHSLFNSWKNTQGEYGVELDSTLSILSHSSEVVKELLDELVADFPLPSDYDNSSEKYRIVDIDGHSLAFILKDGYSNFESSPENLLSIARNILTKFYVYFDKESVATMPVFNLYVNLLSVIKNPLIIK